MQKKLLPFADLSRTGLSRTGLLRAGILSAGLLAGPAFAHCGSAACLLNTSWDKDDLSQNRPLLLSLQYEDIQQDRLQEGSERVPMSGATSLQITHRITTLNLDYGFAEDWAVNLSLPYISREQRDFEQEEDPDSPVFGYGEQADIDGIGDSKLQLRYWQPLADRSQAWSVSAGLKLPTGTSDENSRQRTVLDDDSVEFEPPTRAVRSIQAGTGTTDLLVGGLWRYHSNASAVSGFIEARLQHALTEHDDYQPGDKWSALAGLRYQFNSRFAVLLQTAYTVARADSGVQSEGEETGGRFWTISPGFSLALSKDSQLYFAYQKPLAQDVNGEQLVASQAYVVGFAYRQ